MSNDLFGDRMKIFEDAFRQYLPIRMPVIIRLDGKSFHSYTKGCKRPIDENFVEVMNITAIELCKNLQGCQIAYIQSDEISILFNNYKTNDTQPLFDNNLQKIVSVSASIAGATFSINSVKIFGGEIRPAYFDSRVFVVPKEEVCNCMLWRQKDATRNAIQMLAQTLYSQKHLHKKNCSQLQELIFQKGINFNDCPVPQKRGRCIVKVSTLKPAYNPKTNETIMAERSEWIVDNNIPIFSKDRHYIDQYVYTDCDNKKHSEKDLPIDE